MQCHVCNSSEFVLFDGVYFCKECSSQIEASRKEEAEQEGGFSKKSLIHKSKEKEKGLKQDKLYGDWTTTEAYNFIIYKQVSALISLGASEKLKNVVLYIWSKYLEKCEIAFRTDYATEEIPRLSAFAKKRDAQVLYGNKHASFKQKQTRKYKSKSRKEKDNCVSDELKSDKDKESIAFTTDPETERESDVTSDGSCTSEQSRTRKHSTKSKKFMKNVSKKKLKYDSKRSRECIDNMTISKTLCFCYLGLLYTQDQLLLCDLLRLAKEGKVPYVDITDIFPQSMQLLSYDHSYFTTFAIPTVGNISLTCAKLFDFLKLPSFKHPPLMPTVFRFVKELNLPGSILPIANHLYTQMKIKNDTLYKTQQCKDIFVRGFPKYDIEAMALIVVSLKLMLVLDGKFENEHSKIMMKINILLRDQKMFVWSEWKKQMKLKEFLFMKEKFAYADFTRLDALSADEIIRKYPISKIKEYGDYTNRVAPHDTQFSFARKELKSLIETVTHQGENCDFTKSTSFPLKFELDHFVTESATWEMFKESKTRDLTVLNRNFSSDLIFYRHLEDIAKESEELIYRLLSILYESTEVITLSDKSSCCDNIIRTSSKYWYKNILPLEFSEHTQRWKGKLPSSFVWLLELLCKYLQVSCDDLYLEVLAIEKQLFLHKHLPRK